MSAVKGFVVLAFIASSVGAFSMQPAIHLRSGHFGYKSMSLRSSFHSSLLTNSKSSRPSFASAKASNPGIRMSLWQGKSAKDIDGKVVQLENIAKKVTLVTNVACFCGFTKQYPGFEALQKKFGDKFTVIAFPCNQFGGQEPGTPAQIKEFVKQFGVTFPVMEKIDVNGPNEHPLYTDLKTAQPGIIPFRKDVNWNFTKFLVVDGKVVKRYESITEPAAIAKDIEAYLVGA